MNYHWSPTPPRRKRRWPEWLTIMILVSIGIIICLNV